MLITGAKMFRSTTFTARSWHAGFAPARSPFDAASLAIVAVLALLFAAAIVSAMQPGLLVDPLQASLQNGL